MINSIKCCRQVQENQNRKTTRKSGSERPRIVRTVAHISTVNDLVLSQEDAPQTHHTTWQIVRETGIHHSSVVQIIQDELRLKCVKKRHAQELTETNCITCLSCAKKLLSIFPESAVNFIFFTDEKIFTVVPPVNLQNDRVYALCGTKKRDIATDRLLRTRSASLSWCLSWSQNLDALKWSL